MLHLKFDVPTSSDCSCLTSVRDTMTSIFSVFLDWPIPSCSPCDPLFRRQRYQRLKLALSFRVLEHFGSVFRGEPAVDFDVILYILRSLTSVDMQVAIGIDKALSTLAAVAFPPILISENWMHVYLSLFDVSCHLFFKILESCITSNQVSNGILATCYQLLALWELTGLWNQRQPHGVHGNDLLLLSGLLANERIVSRFHAPAIDSSLFSSRRTFLSALDLADQCTSPQQVLSIKTPEYSFWKWMQNSTWVSVRGGFRLKTFRSH